MGDLDGDGDLDAFVAQRSAQANKVWLNDGSGNFSDSGQSLGNSDSQGVALGDVDGDGDLDAFVGELRGDANKVWLNDGSGSFHRQRPEPGQFMTAWRGAGRRGRRRRPGCLRRQLSIRPTRCG